MNIFTGIFFEQGETQKPLPSWFLGRDPMDKDTKFMQLALKLAQKGAGKVSPNPMVGCVITQGDRIISTGYHKYFGGPHAEIEALSKVKKPLNKATMYLTLEPCSHTKKKTPPCVPVVLNSGIKRLFIAMKDPNPAVNGRGVKILQKNGIKCSTGLLESEAKELNKAYIKWVTQKLPYITLKWAMSLDGKIATEAGDSKWISSQTSRDLVHRMRGQIDSILVGIGTVLKDNPYLTTHGKGRNPVRLIIDPDLRIPLNSNVLNKESKTIIFYDKSKDKLLKPKLEQICKKYQYCVGIRSNLKGIINLKELIKYLAAERVASLLIEGGGNTHAQAIEQGIADEIMCFVSPKVIGGKDAITPVEGIGVNLVEQSINLTNWVVNKSGEDLMISAKIKK
ncbi:MAG: bifunctional diaminohydroxyphosphoribosylaminopyrimidine deaminase/5-amino-6-(5-phosphoribosylamino)uracil reductase RibD [Elusimicrobia bacterium]|nr:bifunctional diaminohydroxyphosphoribosylaminopyrimidine deaminase/5-amino-6-(5-phosphoribosylamino)uracil reductase RibD [Elusimicrobiota bacterium]